MKRPRQLKANLGELRVGWGIDAPGERPSLVCAWGGGIHGADANMLLWAFHKTDVLDGNDLVKELEARGYDLTTLKFSIKKKAAA